MDAAVLSEMILKSFLAFLPLTAGVLASRRYVMSKSANRVLYGAVALVALFGLFGFTTWMMPGNTAFIPAIIAGFTALPLWIAVRAFCDNISANSTYAQDPPRRVEIAD